MAKENPVYVKGRPGSFKYCDKNIIGVYIIINDKTKEFYIGSSTDINRRMSHHFANLKKNKSNCERLQENYNCYNHEDFSFYILYRSDDEEYIREKELELLEDNYDNPLLLNTATVNNVWINDRNPSKVKSFKSKLSKAAKQKTGSKNPFYGRHHTQETKEKLRKAHKGKSNPTCQKAIVINGKLYASLNRASEILKISIPTISHRVHNENPLFINWYEYNGEVIIKDHRLLFKENTKPSGLYEIEGKLFVNSKNIMQEYNLKVSTMNHRLQSENFPEWKRII